jgi:mRNA interferase MazF
MGIRFLPSIRTVVICDYSRGGFQPPEMVKRRPAIVVSPRLPYRDNLCSVVPVSGDPPDHETGYVVQLKFDPPLPPPFSYKFGWVKCDMIATVGLDRLDFFHTARVEGKRKYLHPKISEADLDRLRQGILCALGMGVT